MTNIHSVKPFKAMLKKNFKIFTQGDIVTVVKLHHVQNKIFYQLEELPEEIKGEVIHTHCIESSFFEPISDNEIDELMSILK